MRREWPQWIGYQMPPDVVSRFLPDRPTFFTGQHVAITMHPDQELVHMAIRLCSALTLLTAVELEVADRFAQGRSIKEIGKDLTKSPNTVANQVKSVYQKLKIDNRSDLAMFLSDLR